MKIIKCGEKFRKIFLASLILYFSTFFFVLPHFAQKNWIFSPFFKIRKELLQKAINLENQVNTARYREAHNYLNGLPLINGTDLTCTDEENELSIDIVAVVITTQRTLCNENNFECEPHYLQQTVAALDQEVKRFNSKNQNFRVQIALCSVDPTWRMHRDFEEVRRKFPVFYKYSEMWENHTLLERNTKYVESLDYAFCLGAAGKNPYETSKNSSANYVLMIEDDTLLFKDFFQNAVYILKNRVEMKYDRDNFVKGKPWMDIKFYLPEQWAGFSKDWSTIWILSIFGLFGAMLFCSLYFLAFHNSKEHSAKTIFVLCFLGGLYMILVARVVNKQALMEILRVSPFTLAVFSDRGCCIPAALYPMNITPSIVDYLTSEECMRCERGVDMALIDFAAGQHLESYRVQPNLVQHIGLFTSKAYSHNKNPLAMLFYDFMYNKNVCM